MDTETNSSYGEMLRLGRFTRYSNLLDIGCGDCGDILAVGREYGIKMFGFDRDAAAIDAARRSRPDLLVKVADAEEQNYPDRTFDGILIKKTLSQVNVQTEALYLAACLLREQGLLFLADYCTDTRDEAALRRARLLAEEAERSAMEHGNCETRRIKRPSRFCVGRAFTRDGLAELFGQAGVTELSRRDASGWPEAGALSPQERYMFFVLKKGRP